MGSRTRDWLVFKLRQKPFLSGISLVIVIAVVLFFALSGDENAVKPAPAPVPTPEPVPVPASAPAPVPVPAPTSRPRPRPTPTRTLTEEEIKQFSRITPREAEEILKGGADVNSREKDGWTALIYAVVGNENPDVTAVLLNAGANVNAREKDGRTALMFAARYKKNPGVIDMLLKAGADAKMKSNEGKMAVDYAGENEYLAGTDVIRVLRNASH
jgi:hypothetical protein